MGMANDLRDCPDSMTPIFDFDAYSSAQIAERVEAIGVRKARLPLTGSALLGVIAGADIGLGALYYSLVASDPTATIFPISAFVAAGFEHCIANMYYFALAALWQVGAQEAALVTSAGVFSNLVAVTLGNVVGGSVLVGAIYHLIYRRAMPPQ